MKVPQPRKLPSGSWFIQLRLGGESIPITAATKAECARIATLTKAEHVAGQKVKRVVKCDMTLEQAITAYCAAKSNVLSPATLRGYAGIKKNGFQNAMQQKLSSLKNWQEIINEEASRDISAKTLKNEWGLVTAVLRHNGMPVPTVRLPQVIKKELPWLTPEQIKIFVAAVKGTEVEIPALLALHSLRRSEIMNLSWEKIDLQSGSIRVEGAAVFDEDGQLVHKEENKNESSRRQISIIIPDLRAALEAVEDKSGYVVRCNPNTIWARVNRICRENQIPEVGVHGLRRSFASLAYSLGLSERWTMLAGGWSDPKVMHAFYIKLSEADNARQLQKMADFFADANVNANEAEK